MKKAKQTQISNAQAAKQATDTIHQDERRFKDILKSKIKKRFHDYIVHTNLIGKKGSDQIVIPIPRIDIPKIVFGDIQKGVGQGDGQEGDQVGQPGKPEGGGGAGNQPGEHLIEVDVTLEELADFLAEELELPNLKPKRGGQIPEASPRYSSIAPVGPRGLINFKRTFKEALKREISQGTYDPDDPIIVPIARDFRFRHPKTFINPDHNAVIIYMMDISGSMGGEQKDIVRTEAFWIDLWVNKHYKNVKKRYIVHDSTAKEVSQDAFFHLKESGGTLISSAYTLCAEMIVKEYPAEEWNIYCFHFSDGDNWSQEDTQLCVQLLKKDILPSTNMFGYGQVESRYGSGQFYRDLQKSIAELPRVICSKIENRSAIPASIQTFFGKK